MHETLAPNDYGEGDVSLRSYKCEADPTLAALPLQNANELLYASLLKFGPSADKITSSTASGKYTFLMPGHGMKIEVSLREDIRMIQISTVVHQEVKQSDLFNQRRGAGSHYSLLTKMMRFNVLLNRTGGGKIGAYGGSFVFFQHLNLLVLHEGGGKLLQRMLEDYILQTVEISRDFGRKRNFGSSIAIRAKIK